MTAQTVVALKLRARQIAREQRFLTTAEETDDANQNQCKPQASHCEFHFDPTTAVVYLLTSQDARLSCPPYPTVDPAGASRTGATSTTSFSSPP